MDMFQIITELTTTPGTGTDSSVNNDSNVWE